MATFVPPKSRTDGVIRRKPREREVGRDNHSCADEQILHLELYQPRIRLPKIHSCQLKKSLISPTRRSTFFSAPCRRFIAHPLPRSHCRVTVGGRKPPYQVNGRNYAKANDPSTWGAF